MNIVGYFGLNYRILRNKLPYFGIKKIDSFVF
jgi:hypothetical protein